MASLSGRTGASHAPNEILEKIFFSLPLRSRHACLTVSKNWHSAALSVLYESVPASALISESPALTPFRKHVHLIKELIWTHMNPYDPRVEDVHRFLAQSRQPQQDSNDAAFSNGGPRLTSLIYHGAKRQTDHCFMSILQSQPTLTKVTFVGAADGYLTLSLDDILGCLPQLTSLEVSHSGCSNLDFSRWNVQNSVENLALVHIEPIVSDFENNNVAELATLPQEAPPMVVRPPFPLERLFFPEAFGTITDYDLLFGALPNLVHLGLDTSVLASSWFDDHPLMFVPPPYPWIDVMAAKLSESLARNCPKLRNIHVKSRFATAQLDRQHYIPGAKHNPKENKSPFEISLPKIMQELHRETFQYSSESLNNLICACGSGLTTLDISGSGRPNPVIEGSEVPIPEITSRDLQFILEECPKLVALVARGRTLLVKDMAPLGAVVNTDSCSASATQPSSNQPEIRPKPWACSETLRRLVIGMEAETDDIGEHTKAWAQLGKLRHILALELYRTNLIPRLSHGIEALSSMKSMYTFIVEHWTQAKPSSPSPDDSLENETEQEKKPVMMLDSETVAWMARNWTGLTSLRLDMGNVAELEDEMTAYVQREQSQGRMMKANLFMTRLPVEYN
ncbi:hypothetical protein BGX26_009655 [Mortierella sp. AD094]|nr:hypothetical protein BGX26_009655 [Mortierella sp. AD094]